MTVDLEIPSGAPWPYDEEEVLIRCVVSVSEACGIEPTGKPAVVLHRFGATYGPARFLVTAYEPVEDAALELTLLSRAGMPIAHFQLPMRITAGALTMVRHFGHPRRDVGRQEPPAAESDDRCCAWMRSTTRVASMPFPASTSMTVAASWFPWRGGRSQWPCHRRRRRRSWAQRRTPESIRAFLLEHDGASGDFFVVGAYLHALLTPGEVGALWASLADREEGAGVLLDIRDPRLRRLPWELMRDGEKMLAADLPRPLVRVTPSFPGAGEPEANYLPLRVLVVIGGNDAAAEQQIAGIHDAVVRVSGMVDLEIVRHPSRRDALRAHEVLRPHIVHFIGHGAVADDRGGFLVMHGPEADELWSWPTAEILSEFADWQPRLAILDVCRTVSVADQDAAWQAGDAFNRLGVPAVVAMEADIPGDAAGAFTGELYRALVAGEPLDVAVARGRLGNLGLCALRHSRLCAAEPDRERPAGEHHSGAVGRQRGGPTIRRPHVSEFGRVRGPHAGTAAALAVRQPGARGARSRHRRGCRWCGRHNWTVDGRQVGACALVCHRLCAAGR